MPRSAHFKVPCTGRHPACRGVGHPAWRNLCKKAQKHWRSVGIRGHWGGSGSGPGGGSRDLHVRPEARRYISDGGAKMRPQSLFPVIKTIDKNSHP